MEDVNIPKCCGVIVFFLNEVTTSWHSRAKYSRKSSVDFATTLIASGACERDSNESETSNLQEIYAQFSNKIASAPLLNVLTS